MVDEDADAIEEVEIEPDIEAEDEAGGSVIEEPEP